MNFLKEQNIIFNFKSLKSCKTLKLKIYDTKLYGGKNNHDYNDNIDDSRKIKIKNEDYKIRIYEYEDEYSKTINFVKINSIFNKKVNDFNENDICGVIITSNENKINEATI